MENQECIEASNDFIQKKKEEQYEKNKSKKPKTIPKFSKKRTVENLKYDVLRIEFLGKPENKICPITKQPTTDVHHKKGRIGSLLLDTRYWVALSREGHKFVEENPLWAKENGFSLDRLSND
jgi:hypothetical protein